MSISRLIRWSVNPSVGRSVGRDVDEEAEEIAQTFLIAFGDLQSSAVNDRSFFAFLFFRLVLPFFLLVLRFFLLLQPFSKIHYGSEQHEIETSNHSLSHELGSE